MKKFRIFAGLGGGFGGANETGTWTFLNEEEAIDDAYFQACEIYDSRAGRNGLPSFEDCKKEALEEFDEDEEYDEIELTEIAEDIYNEHREGWIDYWAEEVTDEDFDEDEDYTGYIENED